MGCASLCETQLLRWTPSVQKIQNISYFLPLGGLPQAGALLQRIPGKETPFIDLSFPGVAGVRHPAAGGASRSGNLFVGGGVP